MTARETRPRMMHAPLRAAALLALLMLAACASTPSATPTATSTPSTTSSPTPGSSAAAAELDLLLDRIEAIHPEPWHGVDRADFVSALEELKAQLPTLTPAQAEVGVMRLVAMISAQGRDGHMFAIPLPGEEGPVLPIRVYEFAEGLHLTDAMSPNAGLAGARILALGGHPIDEILAALEPLVPRDGPATVPAFRPAFLLRTEVLVGLGLVEEGPVAIRVEGPDGAPQRVVELTPVPFDAYVDWTGQTGMVPLPTRDDTLYLEPNDAVFWTRFLPESGTLYVRYTAIRRPSDAAVAALRETAAGPDVERVVLDLRQNGGGDNHTYVSLLSALRSPEIDQPGRLFVLTDRVTFSAAANLATEIEQSTDAIFAGEPMGGGLNFWDDVTWVALRALPVPMRVGVSVRYWEKSTPDDPRLTIEPQISLPVTAADYFAGRDPVLEAVTSAD